MCCDKHSYLIIIRLLDIIDDTVLLKKHIIKKIINHLYILMYHDFGRLVLLHLLTPRNDKYFKRNKLYKLLCTKPITKNEFDSNNKTKDNEESTFLEDDDDEKDEDQDIDMILIDKKNEKNNYVDPSKQANCKKDYNLKRIELLRELLPKMVDYSCENIKKLLCHDLAGTIVIELIRILLYDDNVKNIKNIELKTEKLIKSIINSSIIDVTPREMSPNPPQPEPPIIDDDFEINNIVDDSLKIVDAKQEKQGTSLSTIDITKMDPMTAKNIHKLQQHESMKKK